MTRTAALVWWFSLWVLWSLRLVCIDRFVLMLSLVGSLALLWSLAVFYLLWSFALCGLLWSLDSVGSLAVSTSLTLVGSSRSVMLSACCVWFLGMAVFLHWCLYCSHRTDTVTVRSWIYWPVLLWNTSLWFRTSWYFLVLLSSFNFSFGFSQYHCIVSYN